MDYHLFGHTSLRVSELCLGTMNFGEDWLFGIDKKTSQSIFDTFAEQGGNYIDTANGYTDGLSEQYLGEFIAANRDWFVLSTKYALHSNAKDPNAFGASRKNLRLSVENSLRRLNTDYIDILWLHSWDFISDAEEIMSGLHDLVKSGKVLYIGLSNAPSWLLAQSNTLAKFHGWSSFAGLQLEYSLAQRSIEAEYFPLLEAFDLNLSIWSPLGGGILSGKYQANSDDADSRFNKLDIDVSATHSPLLKIATSISKKLNCSLPQLALAWVRQSNPRIIPVIGASKLSQLNDNLDCLTLNLSEEDFAELEAASRPPLSEPYGILHRPDQVDRLFGVFRSGIKNTKYRFPRK